MKHTQTQQTNNQTKGVIAMWSMVQNVVTETGSKTKFGEKIVWLLAVIVLVVMTSHLSAFAQDQQYGPFNVTPGKWLSTGINLKAGQCAQTVATGTLKWKGSTQTGWGPDGYYYIGISNYVSLRGMVGHKEQDNNAVIILGAQGSACAGATEGGELLLGVARTYNVDPNDASTLEGAFSVTVTAPSGSGGNTGGDGGEQAHLRARLDCGDYLELNPGAQPSKSCSVIVSGFRTNTDDRVEYVFPTTIDCPVGVQSGCLPGGIVVNVVGGIYSAWPPNMNRPEHSESFFFSACPQPGHCATPAPAGDTVIPIIVRQKDAGEVHLNLTVHVPEQGFPFGSCPASRSATLVFAGTNADVVGNYGNQADGVRDGRFRLSVATPGATAYVTYIKLQTAHEDNSPEASPPGSIWDTWTNSQGALQNLFLGVHDAVTGQNLMNVSANGIGWEIKAAVSGTASFDLFANDTGIFAKPGQHFLVTVEFGHNLGCTVQASAVISGGNGGGGSSAATLSVGPTSISAGDVLTATWHGIATPTAKDWLGLYVVGTADSSSLYYWYTTGAASDSMRLLIPGTLALGTYEFRLFANNSFQRIATSNSFTISDDAGGDWWEEGQLTRPLEAKLGLDSRPALKGTPAALAGAKSAKQKAKQVQSKKAARSTGASQMVVKVYAVSGQLLFATRGELSKALARARLANGVYLVVVEKKSEDGRIHRTIKPVVVLH